MKNPFSILSRFKCDFGEYDLRPGTDPLAVSLELVAHPSGCVVAKFFFGCSVDSIVVVRENAATASMEESLLENTMNTKGWTYTVNPYAEDATVRVITDIGAHANALCAVSQLTHLIAEGKV